MRRVRRVRYGKGYIDPHHDSLYPHFFFFDIRLFAIIGVDVLYIEIGAPCLPHGH